MSSANSDIVIAVDEAARRLRQGGLVAFPTETVYGLGADATSDEAIASVFATKQRPRFNPLIIHLPSIETVRELVIWNDNAETLARAFWPGPLTFILPRKPDCPVSLLASAGLETLAVRVPAHPLARELLQASAIPVAAPSANRSGRVSPTTATHVIEEFEGKVPVLDGGPCEGGLESTVIDLTQNQPVILRSGLITQEAIASRLTNTRTSDHTHNVPKSPGMLLKHYAPSLPVRLNAQTIKKNEALLLFGTNVPDNVSQAKLEEMIEKGQALNLSPSGGFKEAAANLFAFLRKMDDPERFCGIAVMPVPESGLGVAINDRLRRAAEK